MNIEQVINRIAPFFVIGIGVAFIVFMIFVLSYVVFWGAIIGALLYIGFYIKETFFASKSIFPQKKTKHRPRIYEHDDY